VAIGEPPPGERPCVLAPFNKGRQLPSYAPDHGVEQVLKANRRVGVTSVPLHARGVDTSRQAMVPELEAFGDGITLAFEQPPAAPSAGWITVVLDENGGVVDRWLGDAAGYVVE
jgi:hypothetical protein